LNKIEALKLEEEIKSIMNEMIADNYFSAKKSKASSSQSKE
jgi:hypothetical protein